MKKLFLLTFVACFAMMFASCEKEMKLDGTTWKAIDTYNKEFTYMGTNVEANINMDCTMTFADATKGTLKMKLDATVTAMGQTAPVPESVEEDTFTYTFDGEKGELTSTDPNETDKIPFTYNKKDNVIVIDYTSVSEQLGVDFQFHMVFKQQ